MIHWKQFKTKCTYFWFLFEKIISDQIKYRENKINQPASSIHQENPYHNSDNMVNSTFEILKFQRDAPSTDLKLKNPVLDANNSVSK